MDKIIIPNIDRNKSYHSLVQHLLKPITKFIPVYPTGCSCQYGYHCDDPNFDWNKPVHYEEVDINDTRTRIN